MIRSQIRKGFNFQKVGGCTATAFLCHGYSHKDPMLTLALGGVIDYLETLESLPKHFRLAIQAIWEQLLDSLAGPSRWARVTGPLSAVIATLWEFGFEPRSYSEWLDPKGCLWTFNADEPNFIGAAKEVLAFHFLQHI